MYRKDCFGRKFFDQGYKGPRFAFTAGSRTWRKLRIARSFQNGPAVNSFGTPVGGREVAVQVNSIYIAADPKRHAVGIGTKYERDVFKGLLKAPKRTTQKERCLRFLPVDSRNDKQTASSRTGDIAKRRSKDRATVFRERKKKRGTHLKQSTGR